MPTRIFLLLFFLLSNFFVNSQNLVPNPSFEDTVGCPDGLDQINKLNNWFSARPSPDYHNNCSTNINSGVPQNFWGYQNPASGNGYVGFTTYYGGFNTREFIGVLLDSPLLTNEVYYISIKAVLGLESSIVKCASNNLGFFFSNTYYNFPVDTLKVENQAQVYSNQIITDTLNWVQLTFTFQSDSIYNYMYAGNFFVDTLTNIVQSGPSCAAYYYIDDLCISTDSTDCFNFNSSNTFELKSKRYIISPNPIDNFLSIKNMDFALNTINHIEIYDAQLRKITNHKMVSEITIIPCSEWLPGIYFIRIFSTTINYTSSIIKLK